ncbi:MAG TPA: oligopeptide/dipeptide ABC transporter ATP-binding protein, partial [Acidimicrobiales bacterium]|nr:oligopeptide/dipeptide ABC transporter ATP-binding protein [Acidimicrobiales bacterium]
MRARDLRIELANGAAIIEDVSLELKAGEILGLVGESGSGKTTTALSVFGYHERGVQQVNGEIEICGRRLGDKKAFRQARGDLVSYVPQNPGMALNPSMRIADAIEDMIRAHRGDVPRGAAAQELFGRVGLPSTDAFSRRYPHQLSGGQQQRVCIAIALSSGPAVVVLDEPTTGLDVITQARILKELAHLRDEEGAAMLYITHDLAVVSEIASRIAVMYAGRIVEEGPPGVILRAPRHPYTRGLMASTPDHVRPRKLQAMSGIAVGAGEHPRGCAFALRCPQRVARCTEEAPPLNEITKGHAVRCFEWEATPAVEWIPPAVSRSSTGAEGITVLEVSHLRAEYHSRHSTVVAARDVTFSLEQGGCVALVGESGSG